MAKIETKDLAERHRKAALAVASYRRVEDILNQRLGQMLVFVGLVFVGASGTEGNFTRGGLLTWGTLICFALTKAIWRAQRKYEEARNQLDEQDYHPSLISERQFEEQPWSLRHFWLVGSQRKAIGYCLPAFVTVSLAYCAITAWFGMAPFENAPVAKQCACCQVSLLDKNPATPVGSSDATIDAGREGGQGGAAVPYGINCGKSSSPETTARCSSKVLAWRVDRTSFGRSVFNLWHNANRIGSFKLGAV